MDSFENIIKLLLEEDNYWVMQSVKVNLTKQEKRKIGTPTMPRSEIDIVALNQKKNVIFAIEAKSYLDSRGVVLEELKEKYKTPNGRYKLFTCLKYRNTVLKRLRLDFLAKGLANKKTNQSTSLCQTHR